MMKMNKLLVALPLSLSLLVPTAALADSHGSHSANESSREASTETPAAELRISLDTVLTEHAFLAVEAMRKGVDGAEDFNQASGALLANADDLKAAIASVYGEEGAAQFDEIWKSHIGYFVNYVKATGAGDIEAQEQAKANLDEYIGEQAALLDGATEGRVPAAALEEGLTAHVDQLLMAFDSYVAGDYDMAYNSMREAYAHMTMPAAGLSAAIVDQFPDQFSGTEMPEEMPATGMGGMADSSTVPYIRIIAGLMLAALTGTLAFRSQS